MEVGGYLLALLALCIAELSWTMPELSSLYTRENFWPMNITPLHLYMSDRDTNAVVDIPSYNMDCKCIRSCHECIEHCRHPRPVAICSITYKLLSRCVEILYIDPRFYVSSLLPPLLLWVVWSIVICHLSHDILRCTVYQTYNQYQSACKYYCYRRA